MPTQDVGVRWSEEKYATKDEVKEAYNMSLIDNIWNQIIEYRKTYTKVLDLRNIDRSAYMVTLTQSVMLKVNSIERRLSKVLVKIHDMSPAVRESFINKRLETMLTLLDKSYSTDVSPEMISHLVLDDLSTIPNQYSVLYFYSKVMKYYLSGHFNDIIDYRLLESILKKLEGQSFDPMTLEKEYRREEIESNHYYQTNYVYKAAPIERLPIMVDELCNFLRESDLSPIVKAIIANYYLTYIKPFDFLNEEAITVFIKTVIGHFDFDEAPLLLNIEAFNFNKDTKLEAIKEETQKTLDLTYYLIYMLDFINDDIVSVLDDITLVNRQEIKEETYSISETEKKEIGIEEEERSDEVPHVQVVEINNQPSVPYVGEANVALPIFPAGLDDKDVDAIVTNLLEVYPYLKKTQAHFYARHCTIGKHYTIGQFKEEEDVAYETARTSMDFLAENGFYSKTKIRNKFVYSPVPRR